MQNSPPVPILCANAARRKELAFVDRRVGVASSSLGRGFFTPRSRASPRRILLATDCNAKEGVYRTPDGVSLRLLACCERVANFREIGTGDVRRPLVPGRW